MEMLNVRNHTSSTWLSCDPFSLDDWAKKKVVLFLEIGSVKNILSLTCPHSWMCMRICISNFKKRRKKTKNTKKATTTTKKKTKEEKRMSPENLLKNILQLPRWRFFSSPAHPETSIIFLILYWSTSEIVTWSCLVNFPFFLDLPSFTASQKCYDERSVMMIMSIVEKNIRSRLSWRVFQVYFGTALGRFL